MPAQENFDFNQFEEEAIKNFQDGQGLLGKERVLTPLLKRFLEKALEAEPDNYPVSVGYSLLGQ